MDARGSGKWLPLGFWALPSTLLKSFLIQALLWEKVVTDKRKVVEEKKRTVKIVIYYRHVSQLLNEWNASMGIRLLALVFKGENIKLHE